MRNLMFCLLTMASISIFGQEKEGKILFVVDSIPIFQNIKESESALSEDVVDYVNVVTSKADFGKYKNYDFDKIIFVFTKEYAKRPDDIKNIPSFYYNMYKKDGKWCLKGSSAPYTGKYVDYYLNGLKKDEGFLKDGMDEGLRTMYYINGTIKLFRNYSKGRISGEFEQYFTNGKIQHKGTYKNDKKDGIWKEWYSTGILKSETEYKNGKARLSNEVEKVNSFFTQGLESFEKGKYKEAINFYDKAIALNPNWSDIYFHRSRAFLYDLKFDEAVIDCNKAIELEPLFKDAYSNRAFVRIRKYELKDSRTLITNSKIAVYATKENVEIPVDEKVKICCDLKKGYELGDTKQMITDAIKKYCEQK